jgi:protein-L-isoaspartate(D-aspartate) O-methyltransferase
LARWLDCLDLAPGDRFLHIGCGVGYYTAIAAEAVGPGGSAVGIEIDPELAERARRNLRRWQNVTVLEAGDGGRLQAEAFDAILVNAGATASAPAWLDALRAGGRLLLPLTVGVPEQNLGVGHMLLVTRDASAYGARFVSPVGIFHCAGARTEDGNALLKRSYQAGGQDAVRSLRRDAHEPGSDCWLHARHFCLSRR